MSRTMWPNRFLTALMMGLPLLLTATGQPPIDESPLPVTVSTTGLTPTLALAAITTSAGLQVDLVAAEPLVQDPVAFDWGPDGRLWVVEMRDYPAGRDGRGEPGGRLDSTVDAPAVDRTAITMDGAAGGRVKVLDDTDGDGRYDRAHIFLDKLRYPTGIKVWRDGVLVACAPDILFAQDTDDDGRADVPKSVVLGVRGLEHATPG